MRERERGEIKRNGETYSESYRLENPSRSLLCTFPASWEHIGECEGFYRGQLYMHWVPSSNHFADTKHFLIYT